MKSALQAWANVANVTFSEVADTSTNVGDIRIAFTSASRMSDSIWGYTWLPSANLPRSGDIWINYRLVNDPDWFFGSDNFQSLLHEIGHALGLDHPNGDPYQSSQRYTVMSYNVAPNSAFVEQLWTGQYWLNYVYPDTPMLDDIAAIQYLYGPNKSYRTGNDTYTFDASEPFYRTIWDAGGNDTIDCSNLFRSLSIDLNEGAYSSIRTVDSLPLSVASWTTTPKTGLYDGTNNLAIAYGTVIENAVGGSAADSIRGNFAANKLSGGWGSDSLYGEAGDDTLEGGDGSDVIYGGSGNDFFDWDVASRAGRDTFYGGAGNDVYVLTEGDQVIELANEGIDEVWVTNSYTISSDQFIERLFGFGTSPMTLTGTASGESIRGSTSNDSLIGNAGDDYLWGMEGVDALLGGAGNDSVTGGAGDDTLDGGSGLDVAWFSGTGASYAITRNADGSIRVADQRVFTQVAGGSQGDGVDTLRDVESIRFADLAITTGIGAIAASMSAPTVQRVIELYVAFFNRVPDADGLSYWLTQAKNGMTINAIAEAFYGAGVQYTSLTGFSSSMTNADFVNVVYRNVLGRTEGADAGGLAYWTGELASGKASRGSLVSTMLDSAHTFKGDPTWGWVASLLNNKITVAKKVAVEWGLNALTADESVSAGMAIAKAVTPTDTSAAIALVGISDGLISLG